METSVSVELIQKHRFVVSTYFDNILLSASNISTNVKAMEKIKYSMYWLNNKDLCNHFKGKKTTDCPDWLVLINLTKIQPLNPIFPGCFADTRSSGFEAYLDGLIGQMTTLELSHDKLYFNSYR